MSEQGQQGSGRPAQRKSGSNSKEAMAAVEQLKGLTRQADLPAHVKATGVTDSQAVLQTLLHGPGGALRGGSLEHQATRLADSNLPMIQRQAVAAEIGRMQGNRHLGRVMTSAQTEAKRVPYQANTVQSSVGVSHRAVMKQSTNGSHPAGAKRGDRVEAVGSEVLEEGWDDAGPPIKINPLSHPDGRVISRFALPSWNSIRNSMYEAMIDAMRSAQRAGIARLRDMASRLTGTSRTIAEGIITALEGISEILIRLVLAIVGVLVGFGSGIVSAVVGLIRLLIGIIKGILLFLYGFIDGGERFNEWAEEVKEALAGIIPGLRTLVDNWLTEFQRASEERQTIMIGELTGEILAIIATFEFAAARASSLPRLTIATGARGAFATAGRMAPALAGAGAVTVDVASPVAAGVLAGSHAMSVSQGDSGGQGSEHESAEGGQGERSEQPKEQGELALKRQQLQNSTLDSKHVSKHLPDTPQSKKLIQKEGAAHVFNDEATMRKVAEVIKERGEFTGHVRGADRWGFRFDEPIGYRIDKAGNRIPLHYGEMKVTGDKYHVIPRTGSSQ